MSKYLISFSVRTAQQHTSMNLVQRQTGYVFSACRLGHQMYFEMGTQYRDLGYIEVAPVLVKCIV